jgi:glycosyltransferase involved in cell wall biosynthesis
MGIECQVWGRLTEPGNHLKYLRAMFRMFVWLKRQRIELFHLNRANDWRPAELLAIRLSKIPVVTHFHTVNLDHAPATRWSNAIAAVSHYVAEHSDTQGVPTQVIHNTVELGRFTQGKDIRSQLRIQADQVVVSFVGQIREIKGIADFIDMAKQIPGEHVHFLIAGQCRKKAGIEDAYTEDELLQKITCDPRIQYCGYQERVEDIYLTSDIVVIPSRWQEPFGLIAIEAGAASRPVVATRSGGLPEIIVDGVTGLLAEIGDTQVLAKHVQTLINDRQRRADMGAAARHRVEQEFTQKPIRRLEALYDSLA